MTVIFLLIPLSVVIATGFLGAFIWAVRSGQYEDTCTPAMRLLHDPVESIPPASKKTAPALRSAGPVAPPTVRNYPSVESHE